MTRYPHIHIQQKERIEMMEITKVSVHQTRRYVPIMGWENVRKALYAFANGFTCGAKATQHITANAIGDMSGSNKDMAVGMFLLGTEMIGNRSEFVDNLLEKAEKALKTRTNFNKSYDYDGVGPFLKTIVDIKTINRDAGIYSIGIYAAYSGDKQEERIAEYFDIPRTLCSCHVEVETKPLQGNRFEFDFETVLRKLDTVLDTKVAGTQVVEAMMNKDEDSRCPLVLQTKDGLEVHIQLGRVASRINYFEGSPRDTWSATKDSVLFGELQRDYESKDNNAKATPTFHIVINSSQRDALGHNFTMWEPNVQEKAIDLANKIAAALQQ